jgi:SUZ domain
MRRTALSGNKVSNDGSTAASSSVPSKATSETGAETTSDEGMPSPPDTASSKDRSKWTREEKEAHYKAARERIFRDFQEAHPTEASTADTSANMSRSSSSSGKKKGHKQKTPRDDSFEARSSYVPGFVGMPYTSQNQYHGSYPASGYQSPYGAQTPNPLPAMTFNSNAPPAYTQYDSTATFSGMTFPSGCPNPYGLSEGWSSPQPPQPVGYYNFVQQPGPGYPQYGSGISSPISQYPPMTSPPFTSPNQQWGQVQFQQPCQAPPPTSASIGQNGAPMTWPSYSPLPMASMPGGSFPFGQAPFQQYSSTSQPSNQHPLPGSYNRPAFNPQIRSFVPAGPNLRFGGQAGQPRTTNSPFSAPGSNSPSSERPDSGPRTSSATVQAQESLQKKWGTPAHLPKKPPPPQVTSTFEMENTPPLPSKTSFPPLAPSIAKSTAPVGNNRGPGVSA